MKSPSSAYSMIDGRSSRVTSIVETEERAAEQDVVATGQVLVEAGTQGQQAGHVADDVDRALGRVDDPGQDLEERALAGAVRPDDRERLAALDVQVDVPQRPELVDLRRGPSIWPIDPRTVVFRVNRRSYWTPSSVAVIA